MKTIKIATAGSVDDGKSTLIGRLLKDTNSLTTDKIKSIQEASAQRGLDHVDYSFATDGLLAEREQGITIDVAHLYFKIGDLNIIVADSPGHEEYTRNMITGVSFADASIILIDATEGVKRQTRRHLFINQLMRTGKIIVAMNKMDLMGYSQSIFEEIKEEVLEIIDQGGYTPSVLEFIPISALHGENISTTSSKLSWYKGKSILDAIVSFSQEDKVEKDQIKSRFIVQHAIRPKREGFYEYRAVAGKQLSGQLKVGQEVTIFPSGEQTKIECIEFYTTQKNEINSEEAGSLVLKKDLGVSRGSLVVPSDDTPKKRQVLQSKVCWMAREAMSIGKKYELQFYTSECRAVPKDVSNFFDPDEATSEHENLNLQLNDIAEVRWQLSRPIFIDTYQENKAFGSFIIIDESSKNTVGAGVVLG